MRFKIFRSAAFVAILALVGGSALGAANAWTGLGPDGGAVLQVVFNPASTKTIYANASAGLFRSSNGGATWTLASPSQLNAYSDFALDPSAPSRLYLASADGTPLQISTDGGVTFSAPSGYPQGDQARHVAVSSDGSAIYVLGNSGCTRSLDHALTWMSCAAIDPTSLTGQADYLVLNPAARTVLYASKTTSGGQTLFWRSSDSASTWQNVSALPVGVQVEALASSGDGQRLFAARSDGIWVSTDGATTWTQTGYQSPFGALVVSTDRSHPGNVYAADEAAYVYHSTDWGATWAFITPTVPTGQVRSITVNPANSSQVFVSGDANLVVTSDAGATWATASTGIHSGWITDVSTDPAGDRIYVATHEGGVSYSAAGSTVMSFVNNTRLQQLMGGSNYWGLRAIHGQSGGRLFVALNNGFGSENLVLSLDGGATFNPVGFSQQTGDLAQLVTSSPQAPKTVLVAGTVANLYRSIDGGLTWGGPAAGIPSGAVVSTISAAPTAPNVFYAVAYVPNASKGTFTTLYRSADAGGSWTEVPATPNGSPGLVVVDPTTANTIYLSSSAGVARSTDAGATWTTVHWDATNPEPLQGVVAIDPLHPSVLYGVSTTHLGRSVDSGATWQMIPLPSGENVLPTKVIVDPNRASRLIVGSYSSGTYEITFAPDLAIALTTAPTALTASQVATYQYQVSNIGPYHGTGITATFQLPASAGTPTATATQGSCSVAATTVTCAIGTVLNGASATVTLVTTPTASGSFAVKATVAADQPDPVTTNNSVTNTLSVSSASTSSGGGGGSFGWLEFLILGALSRRRVLRKEILQ